MLCGLTAFGQDILVPHDLQKALHDDSCFVVGGLERDMVVELSFDNSPFYSLRLGSDTGLVQIRALKDSLFLTLPDVAEFWSEYESLPPGNYRLDVLKAGTVLVSRNKRIGFSLFDLKPIYRIDSLSFSCDKLDEHSRLLLRIVNPIAGGMVASDTLSGKGGVAIDYSLFRKNMPYLVNYRVEHVSGLALSDSLSLTCVPNRSVSRDSLKRVMKQQKARLKNEIAAQSAGLFDSLKTPALGGDLLRQPNGMVEVGYGTFRGQNSLFPTNDFFQMSGNARMNILGLPLTGKLYFFENGIDFYSRRDFRLSFDYQSMVHDLEAKKDQLSEMDLDRYKDISSGVDLDRYRDRLKVDTAKYSALLRQKRDSLLQTKALEAALQKRLDGYQQQLEDSLISDSARALYAKQQQRVAEIRDSLQKIQQQVERVQIGIDRVRKLKQRYERGLPGDSLLDVQEARLRERAGDSLEQYMNIDRYLSEQGALNKYEDEYLKAKELYDKLKQLRQFDIGVVTPYRSPYSLSGIAIRGMSAQYDFSGHMIGITGGRMVQSPFLLQTLYNVAAVSDQFEVMELGQLELASTNFWRDGRFQSITEVEAQTESWKGWKAEISLANSLNDLYFSGELPSNTGFINRYNTVVVGGLSKSFSNGLHSIGGRYKYVPASFSTPGNPFLINDIRSYSLNANNSLFKGALNSFVEVEFSSNNTLGLLDGTDFRRSIFSLQQLDLGQSFQVSVLNSVFLSDGFNVQGFNMHDVNLSYFEDFWGNMLSASVGFMHQQFSNGGLLLNQTSMLKGDLAFSKKGNRVALAYFRSVPVGESTEFTTISSSMQKGFFKGALKTNLRLAYNKVELMHPRISLGASATLKVYKSVNLVVDFQGNSLLVDNNQLYNNSSMGVVKLNMTL